MKTVLAVTLFATLSLPVSADLTDTINQKVDTTATSTKGQTDNGANHVNGTVTNTIGNGVLTNAATTRVNGTASSAKSKTDTGATKVKGLVSKTKARQTDLQKTANDSVQKANTTVTTTQDNAAKAIQNAGN